MEEEEEEEAGVQCSAERGWGCQLPSERWALPLCAEVLRPDPKLS